MLLPQSHIWSNSSKQAGNGSSTRGSRRPSSTAFEQQQPLRGTADIGGGSGGLSTSTATTLSPISQPTSQYPTSVTSSYLDNRSTDQRKYSAGSDPRKYTYPSDPYKKYSSLSTSSYGGRGYQYSPSATGIRGSGNISNQQIKMIDDK